MRKGKQHTVTTMTRRNKPNTGKREFGAREVFYAGIAFHRTAKMMAERFEQTRDTDFMVSLYVNAALAAELFLKCLLRRAEDPRQGHKLQKLFEALPEEDQSAIRESFNATPRRNFACLITPGLPPTLDLPFDLFLSHVEDTFRTWRYNYEIRSLADASGLLELAGAIRTRINELEPGWC